MSVESKICAKCDTEKQLIDFKYGYTHCYECQKKMSNDWKARNRQRVAEYNLKYKAENKEEIKQYNHEYNKANRDVMRERTRLYHNKRSKEDPLFKLAKTLRGRFSALMKTRKVDAHTLDILGCTLDLFQLWLMYRFYKDEMEITNHGTEWHLDHVVPISIFDLSVDSEMRKCFHWTNFQPLTHLDNIRKNCYLTKDEVESHESHLQHFLSILPEELKGHYSLIEIDRYQYIKTKKSSNRRATKVV